MQIKNENLKKLSVAEAAKTFGWNTVVCRSMVALWKAVTPQRTKEDDKLHEESGSWGEASDAIRANDLRLAKEISLLDILSSLQYEFVKYNRSRSRIRVWRGVIERLVKIGFTQIDCIALPARTMSVEVLKKIPRAELLKMDASLLGIFSEKYLRYISLVYVDAAGKEIPDIGSLPASKRLEYDLVPGKRLTVSDVLQGKYPWACSGKTLAMFKQLGFSENDSPFLSNGTKLQDEFRQQLMKEYSITWNTARRIVEVASAKGWI